MADEQKQAEMAEHDDQEPEEPETGDTGDETSDDDPSERQAALERTVQNLRKVERQHKKELERLRTKVQEQEDAEKTELQRAQDAVEQAKQRAQEAERRAVRAEAKALAAAMGISEKKIPYAIKLLDLDDVDVSDGGEPDSAAIRAQLEQITSDVPELIAARSNGKVGGTNPPKDDLEGYKPYGEMTYDEQVNLYHSDRSAWERLRAAAGFGE